MHNIFVYGTLRRTDVRNSVLDNSKFLGNYQSIPKYTMYNLGAFPCIVFGGKTSIIGEVYEVDDYTLDRLDMIEGHPNFYTRMPIELLDNNMRPSSVNAQAYFIVNDDPISKPIKSGDWLERFTPEEV
jgi:gamma-glutamylcyclotransferase (GGCT)/AIG2-like uncharacterized protein YtfP